MSELTIVLFNNELRIHDNPALYRASEEGRVIPVYIKNEAHKNMSAKNSWINANLRCLKATFDNHGVSFNYFLGNRIERVIELIKETQATQVYWNIGLTKEEREADFLLENACLDIGVTYKGFNASTIYKLKKILNKQNEHYKVFTPFYKKTLTEFNILPLQNPTLTKHQLNIKNDNNLLDEVQPNWAKKINSYWDAGEEAALDKLEAFIDDGLNDYSRGRDYPEASKVSKLSPYLAVGSISPRLIYARLNNPENNLTNEVEAYLRQLIWREFSIYTLIHEPDFPVKSLRENYDAIPWLNDSDSFEAWKKGETGYPFVDAGMRELYETGYMHNRTRMVVGSFLVKHLLVDWRWGYNWFKETLIDFDTANNAMGWQWVSGSGIDSSPYFRIFNPITQGEKFDAKAVYIKHHIPELARLPHKKIHQLFNEPQEILMIANIELGKNYPYPIVDHKTARNRALEAYEKIKN